MEKITGGYILLARKITLGEIMEKPSDYLKIWVYLLNKAQYKQHGNLKRGQCPISIDELIKVLSYKSGYRTVKPSKKSVWRIIEWLRCPHGGDNGGNAGVPMVETVKVTHGMILTICNYDFYQDPGNYEANSGGNDGGNAGVLRVSQKGNNKYKEGKEGNACNESENTNSSTGIEGLSFKSPDEILSEQTDDIFDYSLTLDIPKPRTPKAIGAAKARIRARLKDKYTSEQLKSHLKKFVEKKHAHNQYMEKYGDTPPIGSLVWCPLVTWKLVEVLSPDRLDKYFSVWEDEGDFTAETLMTRFMSTNKGKNYGPHKTTFSGNQDKYCSSDGDAYPPDEVY